MASAAEVQINEYLETDNCKKGLKLVEDILTDVLRQRPENLPEYIHKKTSNGHEQPLLTATMAATLELTRHLVKDVFSVEKCPASVFSLVRGFWDDLGSLVCSNTQLDLLTSHFFPELAHQQIKSRDAGDTSSSDDDDENDDDTEWNGANESDIVNLGPEILARLGLDKSASALSGASKLPDIKMSKLPKGFRSGKRQSVSSDVFGEHNELKPVEFNARISEEDLYFVQTSLSRSFAVQLSGLDEEHMRILASTAHKRVMNKGELLEGPDGSLDGAVLVQSGELVKGDKIMATRGEALGQIGMLQATGGLPKYDGVVAKENDTQVWLIARGNFLAIGRQFIIAKRNKYTKILQSVPLLEALNESEIEKVSDALAEEEYAAGSFIIEQGNRADKFYILLEGKCATIQDQGPGLAKRQGKVYSEFDYFGELALMRDCVRTASVYAASNVVRVAWFDRRSFRKLFGGEEFENRFKKQAYNF